MKLSAASSAGSSAGGALASAAAGLRGVGVGSGEGGETGGSGLTIVVGKSGMAGTGAGAPFVVCAIFWSVTAATRVGVDADTSMAVLEALNPVVTSTSGRSTVDTDCFEVSNALVGFRSETLIAGVAAPVGGLGPMRGAPR